MRKLLFILFITTSFPGAFSQSMPTKDSIIDPFLTYLDVEPGELDPQFDPYVMNYTVVVPFGTTSIKIDATVSDPVLTITGAGILGFPGGSKKYYVIITFEDGLTTLTYIINVIEDIDERPPALSSLTVNPGILIPTFEPLVTAYSVNLPAGTDTITVSAIANDYNTLVTGTGTYPVSTGDTAISIMVTAADSSTYIEYTITVFVDSDDVSMTDAEFPVKVYPTVTTGMINIENPGSCGSLTLYDTSGKIILKQVIRSEKEQIFLPEAGMYLIKIDPGSDKKVVKVFRVE